MGRNGLSFRVSGRFAGELINILISPLRLTPRRGNFYGIKIRGVHNPVDKILKFLYDKSYGENVRETDGRVDTPKGRP